MDEEHRTWVDMVGAEAADRRARGLGYMDGLAVLASGGSCTGSETGQVMTRQARSGRHYGLPRASWPAPDSL